MLKLITKPYHKEVIFNLYQHDKYKNYTLAEFADLIKQLFPKYRTSPYLMEDLKKLLCQ